MREHAYDSDADAQLVRFFKFQFVVVIRIYSQCAKRFNLVPNLFFMPEDIGFIAPGKLSGIGFGLCYVEHLHRLHLLKVCTERLARTPYKLKIFNSHRVVFL